MILGVITWISFIFSFQHFPNFLKRILLKHFALTDLLSVLTSFLLLTSISKSLSAVIASVVCGLLVNFTLIFYKRNYLERLIKIFN
jgi:ABC-type multidrug transport system permease subunit